ncbi:hypothetical protein [Streptomyces hoynatensis]|nr:hypothetical protein [Streptomyces hoynatensis]
MNPFRSVAKARAARRRHEQLMAAAGRLISRKITSGFRTPQYEATTADLIALAFGRHQLTIDETEADRYIAAARAEKGVTR